jgi:hypothetical protein
MKIKLLIIALVFSGFANAQLPNYLWAKSAGGTGMDNCNSVATDASGNILVTGYFTSPSITFGTTTLTNANNTGVADIFLVKYDAGGNILWAKSAGGSPNDYGNSVATDVSGNILVTGYFSSPSITFGTITLINANPPNSDIFLVKYDAGGNVLWAKSAGGSNWDHGISVSTDASGNVLVTGYFASSLISFGTTTLTTASTGIFDIFLVKYDAGGNVLWAKSGGGSASDEGNSVATDANGNVLVTGYFASSTINFGTTTLTNAGNNDFFLVKYDSAGNVLWAKSEGGSAFDKGNNVFADASGNILVTGFFISSSITFGTTTLTNAGTANFILVKYDAGGNVLWAKSAGGSASDEGNSVSTDASGNILVAGRFTSPSITFGTTTLTNAGVSDIFLVKYDSGGNVLWAKSAGGSTDDEGNSVSTDASGNILVTGFFYSPSITFGTTTLSNAGGLDIFIVKLSGLATGIEEDNFTNAIDIFPNPFSTQITLQTNISLNNATFKMDNYMNQTVAQIENISGQTITFNRGNLPSGLYFVHLTQDNKLFATKKLIITD